MPLSFTLAHADGCRVQVDGKNLKHARREENVLYFDLKTAVAWLAQKDPEKALAEAAKTYDGDGQKRAGERSEIPALIRQFSDFAAMSASEEFEGWCEALYKPMFEANWQTLASEEPRP